MKTIKTTAMAHHTIETMWMGKMQFNSLVNGHTIIMDAPEKVGGEDLGPIPKPFVLTALSGCTGMDIVSILRQQHKQVKELGIKVTGELSPQKPIEYLSMHIVYDFKGDESIKQAALDAVTISQEKYCGVSHMLRKAIPVTWAIVFNGETIIDNSMSPAVSHSS
ncbi:MAG: OsmC family protein [Chitinophagaceae bacterium]